VVEDYALIGSSVYQKEKGTAKGSRAIIQQTKKRWARFSEEKIKAFLNTTMAFRKKRSVGI
jgi:hypothetical protein